MAVSFLAGNSKVAVVSTKTDNIINPNSCWNQAAPDEPVFILRANDELAPDTIIQWANQYRLRKGDWLRMTVEQRQKFENALKVAEAMRTYKAMKSRTPGAPLDDDIPF